MHSIKLPENLLQLGNFMLVKITSGIWRFTRRQNFDIFQLKNNFGDNKLNIILNISL